MQVSERTKLCKLQNNSEGLSGDIVYILYITSMSNNVLVDFAGMFDTRKDAVQVSECLNNIFTKLQDKHFKLSSLYKPCKIYFSHPEDKKHDVFKPFVQKANNMFKYCVQGVYKSKNNVSHKIQKIVALTFSKQDAEIIQKRYTNNLGKIIKYKVNDILPTMYLDDYNNHIHPRQFKHIINELKKFPRDPRVPLAPPPPSKIWKPKGVENNISTRLAIQAKHAFLDTDIYKPESYYKTVLDKQIEFVRSKDKSLKDAIKTYSRWDGHMSEWYVKYPKEVDILTNALKQIPPLDSPIIVWRGISSKNRWQQDFKQFISTTLDLETAEGFSTGNDPEADVMRIVLPIGTKVLPIWIYHDSEMEMLLGPGLLKILPNRDCPTDYECVNAVYHSLPLKVF
jgi:hypothetical protein